MSFDPPSPVRSLRAPALVAQISFAAAIVVSLGALPLVLYGAYLTGDVETETTGLLFPLLGAAAVVVVLIAGGVSFVVWLYRARTNLLPENYYLSWKRGWTIGGWFVPFANLVIPLLVVNEIDKTSEEKAGLNRQRTSFAVWAVSWTLYLVMQQASRFLVDEDAPLNAVDIVGGSVETVAFIVAGISGILMIRRVTAAQERMVELAATPPAPGAAYAPPPAGLAG